VRGERTDSQLAAHASEQTAGKRVESCANQLKRSLVSRGCLMGQHAVSSELLELGHDTIGRLARELAIGAPLVHLQLVASRLYEEIRDELERTPASDGAKVGLLAAAADRCRRSTSFGIAPAVVVSELEVVISMLTGAPGATCARAAQATCHSGRIVLAGLPRLLDGFASTLG
jgi:hypothetical protein